MANENGVMQVQSNAVVIKCDGLYLISLKGFFFHNVSIDIHYRNSSAPIPALRRERRADFTTVVHMGYKDAVHLGVTSQDGACEQLQMNGGKLFLIQLRSDRYCAP
ncbi:PREDICTED: tumor necrosis factor ligand superfamily member 4 [Dipodomys ordii]|uniref:Tumor necrosis factor ligand superfamily member 4 n=1 Tax=Dipodomys ordii TaxID=10020 RepID=A0A1S3F465_DIPOR|nr:PREDICTED: tumor necrosis factor ligand superfamily member 4 [Dipodomys ordii]